MLYFILALDFEIATPPVKQKGVKMAYKKIEKGRNLYQTKISE